MHLKKEKYHKIKYAICILLLASFIGIAFLGPQLIFTLQDKFYVGNIQLSVRNSMDMEALNESYEKDLKKRLQQFWEGLNRGKVYLTTETVYESDAEFDELLTVILEQPWMSVIDATEMIPDVPYYIFKTGYDLTSWKRYTVYDKEFEEGVVFMMYYIDLLLKDGKRIQLLVDAEDYSMYYIQFQREDLYEEGIETKDYRNLELLKEYGYYWYEYYFAENTADEELLMYVGEYPLIVEDYKVDKYAEVEVEENWGKINSVIDEDGMKFALFDIDNRWIWGLHENSEENTMEIYFGILQIGNLIPEIKEKIPAFVQN